MLTLTLKEDEPCKMIDRQSGRTIVIQVIEFRGKSVRIGFMDDENNFLILRAGVPPAESGEEKG